MWDNLTKSGLGLLLDGSNFPNHIQSLIEWTLISLSACFRFWPHFLMSDFVWALLSVPLGFSLTLKITKLNFCSAGLLGKLQLVKDLLTSEVVYSLMRCWFSRLTMLAKLFCMMVGYTPDLMPSLHLSKGRSRLLKGGTTRPVIIADAGLAGIFALILCKAHRHAKHVSTRGVWEHVPQEILINYTYWDWIWGHF